jgi:hypothetical protein
MRTLRYAVLAMLVLSLAPSVASARHRSGFAFGFSSGGFCGPSYGFGFSRGFGGVGFGRGFGWGPGFGFNRFDYCGPGWGYGGFGYDRFGYGGFYGRRFGFVDYCPPVVYRPAPIYVYERPVIVDRPVYYDRPVVVADRYDRYAPSYAAQPRITSYGSGYSYRSPQLARPQQASFATVSYASGYRPSYNYTRVDVRDENRTTLADRTVVPANVSVSYANRYAPSGAASAAAPATLDRGYSYTSRASTPAVDRSYTYANRDSSYVNRPAGDGYRSYYRQ